MAFFRKSDQDLDLTSTYYDNLYKYNKDKLSIGCQERSSGQRRQINTEAKVKKEKNKEEN